MYVAIRRRFASPVVIAAIGVFANMIVMTLIGLAQGNTIYQAIFAGLLVGGLFSGGSAGDGGLFSEQRSATKERLSSRLTPLSRKRGEGGKQAVSASH